MRKMRNGESGIKREIVYAYFCGRFWNIREEERNNGIWYYERLSWSCENIKGQNYWCAEKHTFNARTKWKTGSTSKLRCKAMIIVLVISMSFERKLTTSMRGLPSRGAYVIVIVNFFHQSLESTQQQERWIPFSCGSSCLPFTEAKCANDENARLVYLSTHANVQSGLSGGKFWMDLQLSFSCFLTILEYDDRRPLW